MDRLQADACGGQSDAVLARVVQLTFGGSLTVFHNAIKHQREVDEVPDDVQSEPRESRAVQSEQVCGVQLLTSGSDHDC